MHLPIMAFSDLLPFFRAWIADPLRVASITPSGSVLADLVTREVSPASVPVLELGPGTGAFTQALLARGVRQRDLTLVESGPDFADMLERRFPHARVLRADATCLRHGNFFDGKLMGAVVSGLPLLTMPSCKILRILFGAFRHMRVDGAFYQFTYGPRCPISRRILDRLGLDAALVGRTPFNVPPAAVYRITRRTDVRMPSTRAQAVALRTFASND